jgi:putative tricarboxylic transport membrane protein
MTGRRTFIAALVVLLSIGALRAADLTGKWDAKLTRTAPDGRTQTIPFVFDLTQKGVRLGLTDKDQLEYYVNLLKKVRETPEWKEFMEKGAFNTTFMSGPEYANWVEKAEAHHRELMREAGFLAR